jgi:hypothetical protein
LPTESSYDSEAGHDRGSDRESSGYCIVAASLTLRPNQCGGQACTPNGRATTSKWAHDSQEASGQTCTGDNLHAHISAAITQTLTRLPRPLGQTVRKTSFQNTRSVALWHSQGEVMTNVIYLIGPPSARPAMCRIQCCARYIREGHDAHQNRQSHMLASCMSASKPMITDALMGIQ